MLNKIYNYIEKFFSKRIQKEKEEIELLLIKCNNASTQKDYNILKLESDIKVLENMVINLDDTINTLTTPTPEELLEEELNNKLPHVNVSYQREETDGQYSIDVRNFFQLQDDSIPTVSGNSYDDIALNSLKKVMSMVTYFGDQSTYGHIEYWAYPYQTLKRKRGDCEDGAILLANIMIRSGIPYYRVRLNAGSVNGGGHAYVTYCRETDNEWVVMDWCYWANTKPVAERPTHKEERNYMDKDRNFYVWFSWNPYYCFGKQVADLETAGKELKLVGKRIRKNIKKKSRARKGYDVYV